jgi:hypothetical protein
VNAAALLGRLSAKGIKVRADDADNVRVRPASALTPAERSALPVFKKEIITLVRYRSAVHHAWEIVALGPDAQPEACARAINEVVRYVDDVGAPLAMALHRQWAREWYAERGLCPWCGDAGVYHDPGRGGEP